jgi:hypothetical protein
LSPHYPSFIHTYHPLTSPLHQMYTTLVPAIPDTSTVHYNNRYTPRHTQGPQNPATSIHFPPPTPPPILVPSLPVS